ncbi:UvrD-helicase domain-containing protein [uncultured Bacteroides sp.]|jgi:DNA helicase-2/ATP-dependent DNA helicase PcrA|uniref:UvrD-helicase domain-containing protein n=1 Tax=uncultured Bacteroides sp. TaxID=162156 RepID=UPI0025EA5816|nr:UvrD-helicase domain-containing protein [uncultured Bacteroides sp.]
MEWQISDQDIQAVEELLLPHGAHFPEDARKVIRWWHSTDVAACPGSGKTTVLLAKLKLLADKMPLENGAGICVLSHTNVAVNEIKNRLSDYADRLLNYPNYIGTIQSFIDRFVTMPYLRNISGQNVQVVDGLTYAQHMLNGIECNKRYYALNYVIELNFGSGNRFKSKLDYIQALNIRSDGALRVGKQKKALAGAGKPSTKQYMELQTELLKKEGIIRYQDAYAYANAAIAELPTAYTDLFSSRFQYVFIDEYQDCNNLQRQAIDAIFDSQKCAVFKIGDPDQAIYNSADDTTPDWIPQPDFLPIMTSCRFNQEIANVICKLKKGEKNIVTFAGETGVKPVLFVFSPEKIDRVIGGFISALERHELYDINGIYKAIGAIKKEDSAGLKIGSYWSEFDGSANKKNEYSYWGLVDEIVQYLLEGKLYKTEQSVRRLLCRVFHYISIKHPVSEKDYTMVTMKNALDEKYREQYRQWIYEMPRIQTIDRHSVDQLLRQKINELLRIGNPNLTDIFAVLPEFFLEEATGVNFADISEKNVLIDPIRGRRIVFDTIHGVKGETHDATLYLETNRQGATDLNRILPYFGVGRCGSSNLYDSSRKLAYVGMSRPKKLLCVAMQAATYEKSNGVFDTDWEVIDLRG